MFVYVTENLTKTNDDVQKRIVDLGGLLTGFWRDYTGNQPDLEGGVGGGVQLTSLNSPLMQVSI